MIRFVQCGGYALGQWEFREPQRKDVSPATFFVLLDFWISERKLERRPLHAVCEVDPLARDKPSKSKTTPLLVYSISGCN
jgi:hypothetical protein